MEKLMLKAKSRDLVGKKVAKLRSSGQIPAVVYGSSFKNQIISVDRAEFSTLYQRAGHSNLVSVKIDDAKSINILIHEVDMHPVNSEIIHADLYQVKMDEVIRTTVPLRFVGESTAVFKDEGTLLTNLEEVEVEALPANLPSDLEVDISVLDDFEKSISVADIVAPENVTILTEGVELIAKVDPPRSDEELEELDSEVGDAVPEGVDGEDSTEATSESSEEK